MNILEILVILVESVELGFGQFLDLETFGNHLSAKFWVISILG